MRPLHLAVLGIALSIVMWGSLFITVLTQSDRTNQLLRNDNVLLSQQKQTLGSISANAKIRTEQINGLQTHIDCLFNLATQPSHSSTYILDSSNCTLSNGPLPSPAGPPAKTTAPVTPQKSPASAGQGSGQPAPPKSLTCKLTLGLLGC